MNEELREVIRALDYYETGWEVDDQFLHHFDALMKEKLEVKEYPIVIEEDKEKLKRFLLKAIKPLLSKEEKAINYFVSSLDDGQLAQIMSDYEDD